VACDFWSKSLTITVHHLNNSRSLRVIWLLEELAVPYEVAYHDRDAITKLAPAELRMVHPLGKSPVVVDGDVTVAETGAIVEYLIDHHAGDNLRPPSGTPERLRYTFWMHYAEGSAMPPLLLKLIFGMLPRRSPALLRPLVARIAAKAQSMLIDPQLALHINYWETELGRSTWFAGPGFSAADIMMSFPVEAAATRARALQGRPRLAEFLDRIHARPAYQRALERGGPFELIG
jgi:glutathione S-transferase